METLNTITTNAVTLWNAPIDWSVGAGMIWFTACSTLAAIGFAWFIAEDARRERKAVRRLAYAEAQKVAARRLHLMETQGYVDTRNF